MLDDVAADSAHNIPVATKALATIADALAMYAGPAGGLRSGPASNPSFRAAFEARPSSGSVVRVRLGPAADGAGGGPCTGCGRVGGGGVAPEGAPRF